MRCILSGATGKFWGMTVDCLIGVINELGSRVTVAIDVREE